MEQTVPLTIEKYTGNLIDRGFSIHDSSGLARAIYVELPTWQPIITKFSECWMPYSYSLFNYVNQVQQMFQFAYNVVTHNSVMWVVCLDAMMPNALDYPVELIPPPRNVKLVPGRPILAASPNLQKAAVFKVSMEMNSPYSNTSSIIVQDNQRYHIVWTATRPPRFIVPDSEAEHFIFVTGDRLENLNVVGFTSRDEVEDNMVLSSSLSRDVYETTLLRKIPIKQGEMIGLPFRIMAGAQATGWYLEGYHHMEGNATVLRFRHHNMTEPEWWLQDDLIMAEDTRRKFVRHMVNDEQADKLLFIGVLPLDVQIACQEHIDKVTYEYLY